MSIDRSGRWWRGTDSADVDEFLAAFSTQAGYPTATYVHAACQSCGRREFAVQVDGDEGCAVRICASCQEQKAMLDSGEFLADAVLESVTCPCGGEVFNVAVGFSLRDGSGEVRWAYLGLRCTSDGVLGCYADWKIDYSPSAHLLAEV